MQNTTSRLLWGGILILLGVIFLADNILPADIWLNVIRWWPVLIILLGGWILIKHPRNLVAGIIVLLVGLIALISRLGFGDFNAWNLWPLALIAIGLSLLFKNRGTARANDVENLSEVTIFGGTKKAIESKNFKYGNLTAIFGGIELDLRNAEVKDEATLEIVTIFGGVELKLPENVEVVNDVVAVFGGVDDGRNKAKSGNQHAKVMVKGVAIFGGVSIK